MFGFELNSDKGAYNMNELIASQQLSQNNIASWDRNIYFLML